ncbi:MAG TPA: dipicolinate synthase subunit DpsA [Xanthobacteraceae bacterium]|jgi:dipicolinate synthase subunit A
MVGSDEGIDLEGYVIAIIGGDRREQEIARRAARSKAKVKAYGFPWPEAGIGGVEYTENASRAVQGAHFGLFPIPASASDGSLFAPAVPEKIVADAAFLRSMANGAHIFLGIARPELKAAAQATGITLHEYEYDVALMYLRGPAIVEGALKAIIENTDITIHRSQIGIVGQGTIGSLLARTLVLLGAHVHVAARNPVQRAAAQAIGASSLNLDQLPQLMPRLDILISSVPVQIVGVGLLALLPPHALVVDVAAPPGGIDLAAAKTLGLRHVWARGLGSRAPVTVGASQWSGIRDRIAALLTAGKAPQC